ncbi:MAG TPA: B12-binding domain-containing radical SAM protein [Acidobacteriaceae bacterium]|jgi:radical SAM superfamily enzyme YgiQ (UPF0313 family)|nr:B12-binding domain-containing radical SAM protein [Acidobacteriaceae bacterium]
MNVLLIYPGFPDTYWSFRYALSFQGKRAAQPPLGLMTVAALLPPAWNKRLVDTNVEHLLDKHLAWADVAFIGGMHVQQPDILAIVRRCRARGLRTVVGGPIASSVPAAELECDHVVIGEAEDLIADLARDLEAGAALPLYRCGERPDLERTPLPDLSLIRMRRYSTMTVQYSRGCPFSCEFCDIIEIYGRRPRTRPIDHVLSELDQLYAAGWRGPVFIVDDNFIGNKPRARALLDAIALWQQAHGRPFRFITEASINLSDDPDLLRQFQQAGLTSVFLGIETPDESSLAAANKLQNTRRDLLASIACIQHAGIEVMGGFILGFDTDRDDIFERLVEFIQKSGIPIAMVGLLQALPGTQLFRRLTSEGRILSSGGGNNTGCLLNFRPRMNPDRLIEGYRSVLRRIYSSDCYYQRVRQYLRTCRPRYRASFSLTNLRALSLSVLRQGIFHRSRVSYWKFVFTAALRHPRQFGAAMTMAVMGYHFQTMTDRLLAGDAGQMSS